jgi:hypothetical protein
MALLLAFTSHHGFIATPKGRPSFFHACRDDTCMQMDEVGPSSGRVSVAAGLVWISRGQGYSSGAALLIRKGVGGSATCRGTHCFAASQATCRCCQIFGPGQGNLARAPIPSCAACRLSQPGAPEVLQFLQVLAAVVDQIKNFAVIYLVDISQVPDFNGVWRARLTGCGLWGWHSHLAAASWTVQSCIRPSATAVPKGSSKDCS